jgi:hypothetical protein
MNFKAMNKENRMLMKNSLSFDWCNMKFYELKRRKQNRTMDGATSSTVRSSSLSSTSSSCSLSPSPTPTPTKTKENDISQVEGAHNAKGRNDHYDWSLMQGVRNCGFCPDDSLLILLI